jgi:hypothetical protein
VHNPVMRLPRRPGHATVVAYLALFVALGGTSYAALSISGKNVKNGSLTGADLKNNSVASADVRDRGLLAKDFKAGQLPAGPTGPTGAPGVPGLPGAAGSSGLSKAYYVTRTTAENPLPNALTTVARVTGLPAGKYLITGTATAVNFDNPADFVRCVIRVNGEDSGGSAAWVQNDASEGSTIVSTAAASSTATFDAAFMCGHDSATAVPFVEGIRMWALPVNDLDARTTEGP